MNLSLLLGEKSTRDIMEDLKHSSPSLSINGGIWIARSVLRLQNARLAIDFMRLPFSNVMLEMEYSPKHIAGIVLTVDGILICCNLMHPSNALAPIYFRNASAAVCVFSLTSESSFTNLQAWIDSFTEITDSSALIYIAANKCDLTDEFQVTFEDAKEWAEKQGRKIFKTSAKTGAGISDLFKELASELCKVKASKVQTHGLRTSRSSSCC